MHLRRPQVLNLIRDEQAKQSVDDATPPHQGRARGVDQRAGCKVTQRKENESQEQ